MNNYILDLAIEDEALGISYKKNPYDRELLKQLLSEINLQNNTNYRYLAQLDILIIENINHIIIKYIHEFKSSHIKAILLKQLFYGNDYEKIDIAIKLYNEFKESKDYISDISYPAPNHIITIYDNLLSNLSNKTDKEKISCIFDNPRDLYYLPLTVKQLTKIKNNKVKEILTKCLNPGYITRKIGSEFKDDNYDPSLSVLKYKLTLLSLECLKYYHEDAIYELIKKFESHKEKEFQIKAINTLKHLDKQKNRN